MGRAMHMRLVGAGAMIGALALGSWARAATFSFNVLGTGISGAVTLTATPDTVVGDPTGAYTIQTISGTFSDAGVSISNAAITGLVAISPVSPPVGAPAPVSLSFLNVANPPPGDTAISYDNLFYPGGSPVTCAGYPFAGGIFDVYGVVFTLNNGDAVDFFSNGEGPGMPLNYGAVVIALGSSNTVIDYAAGGLGVPEPATWSLMLVGLGALGTLLRERRRSARIAA
jgi:hypothetical protein